MQFLYKIPGYILLLFGGFCLSWGGFIIRSFEEASIWQILFLRSFFFLLALIAFLLVTYKKNTFCIIICFHDLYLQQKTYLFNLKRMKLFFKFI